VKEFTENLRGAPAGEERSFEVAYPREFSDPRLAGNTISYRVKVLGIKKKQLPELNDELARELGEFDSLEAVRQRVREDLSRAKRRDAVDEAKKRLRRELVELHDFPVPDLLVERQLDRRMERLRRQIASQGVNLQTLDVDWGKVRGSQREAALEDVKSSLILERIAEQESVDVQEEELEREIEKLAAATNQPAPALRARLTREGTLDKIKSTLRVEKALELVLHHATGSVSGVGSTGAGSLG
jgi:trigger factor